MLFNKEGKFKKMKKAIAAGYYFCLVSEEETEGISLSDSGIRVCVYGTTYPVYKGDTFQDSQAVDMLMDNANSDMLISDYRIAN